MDRKHINQGDILGFLTSREAIPFCNQKELVERMNDRLGPEKEFSHISEIIHGGRNGWDLTVFSSEDIFEAVFCEKYDEINKQNALKYYQRKVKEAGITFENWEGKKDDTFDSYMQRMFSEGIFIVKKHKKTPKQEIERKYTEEISPRPKGMNVFTTSDFTGRKSELEDIEKRLKEINVAVLTGIGGIGKTQLAMQYAAAHKGDYDCILVLSLRDEKKTIQSVIADIIFDGHDDRALTDEKQRTNYRMDYFQRAERVLLIFDNVDNEKLDFNLLEELFRYTGCHKIITTRLKKQFENYMPIQISALKSEEQMTLFKKKLSFVPDKEEERILAEILRIIHGHTKMIEIMASYINTNMSCSDALNRLKDVRSDNEDIISEQLRQIYQTDHLSEEERRILLKLYILPEDGVSLLFLRKYLLIKEAGNLTALENKSLVEVEDKTKAYLHPIVREMLRKEKGLSSDLRKKLFDNLCSAFDDKNAVKQFESDLCNTASALIPALDFSDCLNDSLIERILMMSDFCFARYRFRQSNSICSEIIRQCEKRKGNISNKEMYNLYREAGKTYQRLANYEDACNCFSQALPYAKQISNVDLGKCLRALGEVYRKDSKYAMALKNDLEALNYLEDMLDIAEAKNAIGVVYINLADSALNTSECDEYYKMAFAYYTEALELRKEYHAGYKDIAYSYHNIGSLYNKTGEYSKAIEYHKKALEIREKNNIDKSDIAASLAWIGNDYTALGELEEAKKYIDHSLRLREELYGKNHPDFAWGLSNLFDWYIKCGLIEDAIKTIDEIIMIRTSFLGKTHDYTKRAVELRDKLLEPNTL